jgi:hypothetical protein
MMGFVGFQSCINDIHNFPVITPQSDLRIVQLDYDRRMTELNQRS